jgi:beta-lactamase superfamily II metal-dependent hydrolase
MPGKLRYLDSDIVRVYRFDSEKKNKDSLLATLFWGDSIKVLGKSGGRYKVSLPTRTWSATKGYVWKEVQGAISGDVKFRDDPVLKVRFVDVGQGDAAIIETPSERVILVDGGEEEHLRYYVTTAWSHVLRKKPLNCDAIVVTHGDADHYNGLPKLVAATRGNGESVVTADRIFHNGLIKADEKKVKKANLLGRTRKVNGRTFLTQLEDNLLDVDEKRMNASFIAWKEAIRYLKKKNGKLKVSRLEYGDNDAFSFLDDEGIRIEVLGPVVEDLGGTPALPALSTPGGNSYSASHTINGHSVVLKLTFGNVRFLFGADLNAESEESLLARARADNVSLAAEILKVPHHGSADFSPAILEAIRPVVSVVSSGDENQMKEYIHPRAGLVGALGKYSRPSVTKPLVYVTEMVAFFRRLGRISAHKYSRSGQDKEMPAGTHINNAYEKASFGIVHVRTDGTRVLVATHSGKPKDKEAYVFTVNELGDVVFEEEPSIL